MDVGLTSSRYRESTKEMNLPAVPVSPLALCCAPDGFGVVDNRSFDEGISKVMFGLVGNCVIVGLAEL